VLRVTFTTGKGVLMRGHPFTVHTSAGAWYQLLSGYLKTAKMSSDPYLFGDIAKSKSARNTFYKTIRDLYRAHDNEYDVRSTRRGSIEELATVMPMEQLTLFSGHASVHQLNRYLRWGRAAIKDGERTIRAARKAL
jgi:hypothetical protein